LVSINEDITKRGFKYTFRAGVKATRDTGLMVEGSYAIGERAGKPPKTFALVYENTEWGQGNAELLKGLIAERKGQIVFNESYAASAADLTPLIMKVKAAKPDVLMLASYLADSILISKTVQKQKVDLMATANGGGGAADASYLPSAGDAADYEFSVSCFDAGLLTVKKWAKPVNDAFKAKYGADFDSSSGEGYGNIWLIKDVLERAGSADREKIRDALAKTNYTSGKALLLPHKKITFDENGQNPYADEVYLQAYKGKYYIVYPFEFADPDFKAVWPKPKWSERK
jgi:branched-chain amino acid transport system substrate-binding protein